MSRISTTGAGRRRGQGGRHELRVERLVAGGDGLGRLPDGRAAFVAGVTPGELVSIEVSKEQRDYVKARLVRVIEPGEGRRPLPCPHGDRCGGCPWLHLDYPGQLRAKEEVLREALRRTGGREWTGEIVLHPSPETGYRDRVRWKVAVGPGGPRIGFHAAGSHRVVEVESCLLVPGGCADGLPRWREALREAGGRLRGLEELVHDIAGPGGGLLTLRFPRRGPRRSGPLRSLGRRLLEAGGLRGVAALLPGGRRPEPLAGEPEIERSVGGFAYRVHGGVFFQVNAALRERLQERVAALAGGGRLVVDLFAGVGFFTLPLARRFECAVGVESGAEAVRLARANAVAGGVGNVRFEQAQVHAWSGGEAPEAVVADPSRSGLGIPLAGRLAGLGQRRTVLVACDPVSLARDLRPFLEAGHELRSLEIFDLFPGTCHMEVVALVEQA